MAIDFFVGEKSLAGKKFLFLEILFFAGEKSLAGKKVFLFLEIFFAGKNPRHSNPREIVKSGFWGRRRNFWDTFGAAINEQNRFHDNYNAILGILWNDVEPLCKLCKVQKCGTIMQIRRLCKLGKVQR